MFAIVHLSQQAVIVDLDFGLLHARRHSLLHFWVAEAGAAGFAWWKYQMDTRSLDAETEQSLHGGVDINAVSIDDGII